MSTDVRNGFKEAARFFVETVTRVPDDRWDAPGLGSWSVREVAAHTAHTFEAISGYESPARTAERIELTNPTDFYLTVLDPGRSAARDRRAQERGRQLSDSPPSVIRQMANGALAVLDGIPDGHPSQAIGGGVRFIDWLATRVVELTVHGLDIARAVDIDTDAPSAALTVTLNVLSDLAVATGKAGDLAMAATGRGALPSGYSLMS